MKGLTRNISAKDKLRFLQDLLTGMIDITNYMPPKHYNVQSHGNGVWFISEMGFNTPEITMNDAQYEAWRSTLKENDICFTTILQRGNDPLIEFAPNRIEPVSVVEGLEERPKEVPTVAPKTEARKQPKTRLKNDPATIEAIQVRDEIFIMKSYGKLSEYGDTWKIGTRQNN